MLNRFFKWLENSNEVEMPDNPVSKIHTDNPLSMRISDDPIRNGIAAETILNDAIFRAALDHVRQMYLHRFEQTNYKDVEQVRQIHLGLAALKDITNTLLKFRFDGQTALREKERLEGGSTIRAFKRNP
jgi:hypothetical protein